MLMDKHACGNIATWDEIRPTLSWIKKAGNVECANFIATSSSAGLDEYVVSVDSPGGSGLAQKGSNRNVTLFLLRETCTAF
jgi:hypothetical protein